jgi:hypothetical protein
VASHLVLLLVFSLCVSVVFAALTRETPREQMIAGIRMLGGMVGVALILGWLMYPFPL